MVLKKHIYRAAIHKLYRLYTHKHAVFHVNAQHAQQARLASVIEMLSPGCEAADGNEAQRCLLPSGSAQSRTARGSLSPQTQYSSCRKLSLPLVAKTHYTLFPWAELLHSDRAKIYLFCSCISKVRGYQCKLVQTTALHLYFFQNPSCAVFRLCI